MDEEMLAVPSKVISTEMLGVPRIVEQRFENPDGTEIVFDKDLNGYLRDESPSAGPIESLVSGYNKVKVWEKNGCDKVYSFSNFFAYSLGATPISALKYFEK